jgi:hypothetical protein
VELAKEQVDFLRRKPRHDGIEIPASGPFAVLKNTKDKPMKIIKNLTVVALAATVLFQTSIIRADDNRDHRDAVITWTKHVTEWLAPGGEIFATIAGVAGGDLGTGTVLGDALSPVEVLPDGYVTFEAEYRLVGSKHSMTVHFRTVHAPDNSGVIIGLVTDGWLKGNVVEGHYTARSCEFGVDLTCFDGTFVIKKGPKAKNNH